MIDRSVQNIEGSIKFNVTRRNNGSSDFTGSISISDGFEINHEITLPPFPINFA
jgi:hypothetical protein